MEIIYNTMIYNIPADLEELVEDVVVDVTVNDIDNLDILGTKSFKKSVIVGTSYIMGRDDELYKIRRLVDDKLIEKITDEVVDAAIEYNYEIARIGKN